MKKLIDIDELKFKIEMAQERWSDFRYDFRTFFVHRWWRFQDWRRKHNPELVKLDTFRNVVGPETRTLRWFNL